MKPKKDLMSGAKSPIIICKHPYECKAETDYGTGVTECECGAIGWLGWDGHMYNHPKFIPPKPKEHRRVRLSALEVDIVVRAVRGFRGQSVSHSDWPNHPSTKLLKRLGSS